MRMKDMNLVDRQMKSRTLIFSTLSEIFTLYEYNKMLFWNLFMPKTVFKSTN